MLWEREQEEFLRFKKKKNKKLSTKLLGSPCVVPGTVSDCHKQLRASSGLQAKFWYRTQIQRLATLKAHTQEAGAVVRKNDLFKCQQPEKIVDSCPQNHLNVSVHAEVFIGREKERGTETRWRDCGHAAMSLLILIRIFNVSTLELVRVSHIPVVKRSM